jgi:HEAT repeats
MNRSLRTYCLYLTAIVFALSFAAFGQSIVDTVVKAETTIECEPIQPAGSPVLLQVKLTNTGTEALTYWNGGPGKYPNAFHFPAHVTDAAGTVRDAKLSNGQYQGISGGLPKLLPGQSLTMPAAFEPLTEGNYILQVGVKGSTKVTIRADRELLRKRESDIVVRVRNGEPFGQHVAIQFGSETVLDRLADSLLDTGSEVVYNSAFTLSRVEKLPKKAATNILPAMEKQLGLPPPSDRHRESAQTYLAILASKIKSDDALTAVLNLAHSRYPPRIAIDVLAGFKQERAKNELLGFLKHDHEDIQFSAARVLAKQKDPKALEVLIRTMESKSRWRPYACRELVNYPFDSRVEPILRKALREEDLQVRDDAKQALIAIERERNRAQPEPP